MSDSVEEAKACLKIIEDEEKFKKIIKELEHNKIKSGDLIGFRIDGEFLEDSSNFDNWYKKYKADKSLSKEQNSDDSMICFITGESVSPMNTTPKITGLKEVGGHSTGDSLISFDKSAFSSYGLEKAKNACVSEESMSAIKVAIEDLINNSKLTIPGCKILYWYKEPTKDIIQSLNNTATNDEKEEVISQEDIDADITKVDDITQKLKNGEDNLQPPNNMYYIFPFF